MNTNRRIRFTASLLSITFGLTSCGSSTKSPTGTTLAPASEPTLADTIVPESPEIRAETEAATTEAPSTEPVGNSTDPVENSVAAPDLSNCALGQPSTEGEVTFVQDGALLATDGAQTRCLINKLDNAPQRLRWNPTGANALINSDQALFSTGDRKATGFLGPNPTVRWSYPTGRNLVGIAKNGELAKRDPQTLKRTVLGSQLTTVDEVVYQPAGTSVTVVGRTEDGGRGIWTMPNVGGNAEQLVENETAERVWDLHYDKTGLQLFFLADHPVSADYPTRTFHVHRLNRDSEDDSEERLTEPVTSTEPLDHLVVSEYDQDLGAVRVGECGSTSLQVFTASGVTAVESDKSLDPVGWLPGNRLVVEERPKGTCDGPAELALWTPNKGLRPLGVGQVLVPAIRAVRPIAQDVATDARAPEA